MMRSRMCSANSQALHCCAIPCAASAQPSSLSFQCPSQSCSPSRHDPTVFFRFLRALFPQWNTCTPAWAFLMAPEPRRGLGQAASVSVPTSLWVSHLLPFSYDTEGRSFDLHRMLVRTPPPQDTVGPAGCCQWHPEVAKLPKNSFFLFIFSLTWATALQQKGAPQAAREKEMTPTGFEPAIFGSLQPASVTMSSSRRPTPCHWAIGPVLKRLQ
jgi:hypothetical protein